MIRKAAIFLCCLYPLAVSGEHDTALRIQQGISCNINSRFSVNSYAFKQINDNVSDFNYIEAGVGVTLKTRMQWFAVQLYYQQSFSEDDSGSWPMEIKPSINFNVSFRLSVFRLYNQLRYEHRFTPGWSDFRIKNYFKLAMPPVPFKPYIGWEMYYEHHEGMIALHRIRFGFVKHLYKAFSLGGYYRLDFYNDSGWDLGRTCWAIQVLLAL